ncbi:MAG: protein transport protein S31 [Icmadophila ericetorum]|nr:protein transport protein S31 [Icmadophila ericetorum]
MARLRDIPRTATFAWSPGTREPFIATGTRAGAVDADFSNDTQLELWDLDLSSSSQGGELTPAASIATDSRFHDIAWVQPKDEHSKGVIAGALENGSLDLWDVENLLNGNGNALMSRTSKHSGAIKTLQFNPFRSELLATAGAKGELFISDLNNIANPFRLGNTAARADDFECMDWNKKVPHIMVTGSSGGFVTVWDVKAKKESLTLNNYGRKPVGAVAWDPLKPTRLITAVPLDTDPLILVWDLRNSNAPERVLRGHEGGVLSLSWCQQDSDLLLSCGKDNRTLCWNPQTGEAYGEFPVVTNWTFQTRWNPHNPSIFATASFDGKIAVQTIQNTGATGTQGAGSQSQALDGEDFFSKPQLQSQGSSFTLPKAPKWLERPCGATFGFGGKIVSFTSTESDGAPRTSAIKLSTFAVDDTVGPMTDSFEKAMNTRDFRSICELRIAEATLESDKNDWKVIETLIAESPREYLVKYLGLSKEEDPAAALSKLEVNGESRGQSSEAEEDQVAKAKKNRLSSFFDTNSEADNFLSDLSSTKGAKTNNPFSMYSGSDSDSDRKITQFLLLGQFSKAMEICIREDRLSDAFMIATCGGEKCIEQVQKAYFAKQESGPNYLRLLASIVGKNLWDLVYNADLQHWREVMATLCTFAIDEEFPDLCEALGDRLEERLRDNPEDTNLRKDASFCYIAGSKLEKVVKLWIAEMEQSENFGLKQQNEDSNFSVRARLLQSFIEKVTVFREVTHYQDTDRQATSHWKLAPLYSLYTEYADIVASHGQLQVAEKYLDLLPEKYPAAEVARNRVKLALQKPVAASTLPSVGRQPMNATATPTRASNNAQAVTFEDQMQPRKPSIAAAANPYAPPGINLVQNSRPAQAPGLYGPSGYQPPQQTQQPQRASYGMPPQPQYGTQPPPSSLGPPPGNFNQAPSIPPPSKAQNMTNWNDIPENFTKPPTSRRGTPAMNQSTINAPFPNMSTGPTPPMASQPFMQPRSTPPAPPPKGPPPRSMTPQTSASYQPPERPGSSTGSKYAPQQSLPQQQMGGLGVMPQQPQIPRGPSPYNAPPSAPPPSNRYAPAPSASAPAPTSSMQRPQQPIPPPPNPYSQHTYSSPRPPSSNQMSHQQAGPPPSSRMPPGPPPQGPSRTAASPVTTTQSPPPSRAAVAQPHKPTTPKYPPGDRSHIPPSAMPIYEILSEDMARVKAKAPASYKNHVIDAEKRLNILFDHLNNEDLLKGDTVREMCELSFALRGREYEKAKQIHVDVLSRKMEECGTWMIGVKRLISMSAATP